MSLSTTLAPSRTNTCAAAPPKPISSPLIAAAAPVSSATLPWSRILSPCASLTADIERHLASCLHRRRGPALQQRLRSEPILESGGISELGDKKMRLHRPADVGREILPSATRRSRLQ